MRKTRFISIFVFISILVTGALSAGFIDSDLTEVEDISREGSSFMVKTFGSWTGLGVENVTGMAVSSSNDVVTFRSWESLATKNSKHEHSSTANKIVTWRQQTSLRSETSTDYRNGSETHIRRKKAYLYPVNMSNHFHVLEGRGNVSFVAFNGLDSRQSVKVVVENLEEGDYNNSIVFSLAPKERRTVEIPVTVPDKTTNFLYQSKIASFNPENSTFEPVYARNFILGNLKVNTRMKLDGGKGSGLEIREMGRNCRETGLSRKRVRASGKV
jgi:hypothetical protein